MLSSWLWKFFQTCVVLMVSLHLELFKKKLYIPLVLVHYVFVPQLYGSLLPRTSEVSDLNWF